MKKGISKGSRDQRMFKYMRGVFICLLIILCCDLFASGGSGSSSPEGNSIVFTVFKIIGSLGFFIYGMKVMSEGIQKAAGNSLRRILGAMTKNRYLGVFAGFLITAIVQSSSATTVMTVSFVNAGLLSLVQSAGVMMGANIGTTITGWLVSLVGFKVKIGTYAMPIIAIGFPLMFAKRSNLKFIGEFILGFALLFLGLEALKESLPNIEQSEGVKTFIASYADYGILSSILFVLIGALVTVVLQSSSASMTLTLTLCYEGLIPFEVAAPMILGENIGTTITAELASIIANVHAKRSARIHSLFNIIGVTWMILLYPFVLKGINLVMIKFGMGSPLSSADMFAQNNIITDKEHIIYQVPLAGEVFLKRLSSFQQPITDGLAFFHTTFNLANVLLLIWFVPQIVRLAERTVKSKGKKDEQHHLEYITAGLMNSPELSLIESRKEVAKFGEITSRILKFLRQLMLTNNDEERAEILDKIAKYEEITDKIEIEIANYLTRVAENELSNKASEEIRAHLNIIGELERMADNMYQMSKNLQRKHNQKIWFTPSQRNNILDLLDMISEAFEVMKRNLQNFEESDLVLAKEQEEKINQKRNVMREEHLRKVEKNNYDIRSGLIYTDLFNSCEKLGDQIMTVSNSLDGKI